MMFTAQMSPHILEERMAQILNLPLHEFVGLELLEQSPGRSTARIHRVENISNLTEVIHGGVLYAILDFAAYAALLPLIPDRQNAVTHDIHVSVMRPAPVDIPLVFKGEVVKVGKRLAFCNAEAYYKKRFVASARLTKSIVELKPLPR